MKLHSVEYDYFNHKVTVESSDCKLRIEMLLADTGQCVCNCSHDVVGWQSIWAMHDVKWHSDFIIKVYIDDVLEHTERTNIKNKNVLVLLDSKAIGDTLAWFPYVLDFQKKYGCNVLLGTFHNYLFDKFKSNYIKLVDPEKHIPCDVAYRVGCFEDCNLDPFWFRTKPLQKCCADILGVLYREKHVDLRHLAGKRPIKEKYAVISTTSTMDCKEWLNPTGWQETIDHLKSCGYKVVCIPKTGRKLTGLEEIEVPDGLVDGALTYIKHADMVVGLSSGLSWLARCLNVPVVMISGFTEPYNEFKTGIARIINKGVCHGCYQNSDFGFGRYRGWCPKKKKFECTRRIGIDRVKVGIESARVGFYEVNDRLQKKIMCVLPHCSTGGLPQYFLEKLKILKETHKTYVVEWGFAGDEFDVQRKQVRELCTEFIEMGDRYHSEFLDLVDDILPDVIHFEEFPTMFYNNQILADLHNRKKNVIVHTSHSFAERIVWDADKYIFPSKYLQELYSEKIKTKSSVIEYPVFDMHTDEASRNAVLNVGILSPHKNQAFLVDVARCMPEIDFIFVGSMAENYKEYWEPLVATAPSNCIFMGQLGEDEIFKLYRECKLFYHTSKSELCPLVFNEAISHGIPVLVNWLPVYGKLPFADLLHMADTTDLKRLTERIEKLMASKRVRAQSTFGDFISRVATSYEGI